MLYQLRKCKLEFDNLRLRFYDWGIRHTHNHTNVCYISSADIIPDMPKRCRVTKVKVLLLFLVLIFNVNLFESSASILEKRLLNFINSESMSN